MYIINQVNNNYLTKLISLAVIYLFSHLTFCLLFFFFPIYFYKLEANYNIVVVFAIH